MIQYKKLDIETLIDICSRYVDEDNRIDLIIRYMCDEQEPLVSHIYRKIEAKYDEKMKQGD